MNNINQNLINISPSREKELDFLPLNINFGFSPKAFLKHYNKPVPTSSKELYESCWKTLFELRDSNKKQQNEDYIFTYMTMAKFLVDFGVYPAYYADNTQKKQFISQLIDTLHKVTPDSNKAVKKWSQLYVGLLFEKFACDFHSEESHWNKQQNYYAQAWTCYEEAIKLQTTRTTHLLAARLLLNYGYVPKGMDAEQAKTKGAQLVAEALESKESAVTNKEYTPRKVQERGLKDFAKPKYIQQARKQLENSPKSARIGSDADEDSGKMPIDTALEKIYPTVVTKYSSRVWRANVARKVLYLYDTKKQSRAEITQALQIHKSIVGQVLIANGRDKRKVVPSTSTRLSHEKVVEAFQNLAPEEKNISFLAFSRKLGMPNTTVTRILEQAGLYHPKKKGS
ncbi:MAG: hypothetical protein JSR46_10860 [Verrucomicrobia bacterium]|nr:hypothetical protein [Verrucomicrobiota bacterium]